MHFPIQAHSIYLNHAAISPLPRPVVRAIAEAVQESAEGGAAIYHRWMERIEHTRTLAARLINAGDAGDIAFCKNTSEALSLVALGLDWAPGDNVVLPAGEFPSNRLPWLALAERGVDIREVDIRSADSAEAALVAETDSRTRVLTTSAVHANDGFRMDLPVLGTACRKRGIIFCVDAIQQLGALATDVQQAHIDCLACGSHKWLLSPEGIGLLYLRPALRPQIALQEYGWWMFEEPYSFGRGDWQPPDTARRFEGGSPNNLGLAGLNAALQLLFDHDIVHIERQVLNHCEILAEGLAALPGIELVSALRPKRRSSVLAFRHDSMAADTIQQRLAKQHIQVAVRDDKVRLSPHFYNTEQEMERVLAALGRIVE